MLQIALGTRQGVFVFAGEPGRWERVYQALEGEDIVPVRCFPDDADGFMAGTYGRGLFRVNKRGREVKKLPLAADYMRTLAFAPGDPATVLAGTEPAELYMSRDRGDSWNPLDIRRLPQASHWSLPYSPRAGALRSLILPSPCSMLAGVEQGGFLRSADGGLTWYLEDREVNKDIHSLAIWRDNPFRIFAATGEGIYRSVDQGARWVRLTQEYTRGVAIDSDDALTVFAGPAADVGEGGWIIVSRDGGASWERCMGGLPDPLEEMVQCFYVWEQLPGRVFALLSNGELYESETSEIHWRRVFSEIEGIQSVDLTSQNS